MVDSEELRRDLLSVFKENRMEADRTMVAISAAGVGLLVTLVSTTGTHGSRLAALLYVVAIAFFLLAIVLGVEIFKQNADLAQRLVRGETGAVGGKSNLPRLDAWVRRLFLGGMAAADVLGITLAIASGSTETGNGVSLKEE